MLLADLHLCMLCCVLRCLPGWLLFAVPHAVRRAHVCVRVCSCVCVRVCAHARFFSPARCRLAAEASAAGVDGFIIVDLPGEAASTYIDTFNKNNLSFVPLITPATTDERMARLAKLATGFVYCISVTGITGQRKSVATDLSAYMARVRKATDLPLAVGFGVSQREHVLKVGELAECVVVGSAIVAAAAKDGVDSTPEVVARNVKVHL